ncbi:hypothetical protein [Actinoplanes subglobosus]|uniref:Uncharacterized protein n=1 Tax=Actinoplanes subglobosus TaxID=1547892 RepID=A0ABV8IRG8_9ACTN
MNPVCLPEPAPRRRPGQVVIVLAVLLLAMTFCVTLLAMQASAELTITLLGAVAAITAQLSRLLPGTRPWSRRRR